MDIRELRMKFTEKYSEMYEKEDTVDGFDEAVDEFDEKLAFDTDGFRSLVEQFVDYHGDFISSDREAAAFIFALREMN